MISQSEPHAARATHTPLREVHMLPPLLDATGVRCSCINVILSRISNMRITSANLDVISKTFWGKKMPTAKWSQMQRKFKNAIVIWGKDHVRDFGSVTCVDDANASLQEL